MWLYRLSSTTVPVILAFLLLGSCAKMLDIVEFSAAIDMTNIKNSSTLEVISYNDRSCEVLENGKNDMIKDYESFSRLNAYLLHKGTLSLDLERLNAGSNKTIVIRIIDFNTHQLHLFLCRDNIVLAANSVLEIRLQIVDRVE